MALLSGILFAFGAMWARQESETSVFEQILALFLCGLLAALALSLFPLAVLGRPPSLRQLIALAPWLVLVAVGFLIPVMWGATRVPATSTLVDWAAKHHLLPDLVVNERCTILIRAVTENAVCRLCPVL
jgi:drug/metabolite transporter (DMT)-like permease